MMKLGIFGGTFDPPHLAHLILAAEAQHQLDLARVLWVLTPDPPHKGRRVISAAQDRVDMLAAAIIGNAAFEISRVELERPGPHFAADTMRLLGERYPEGELIYLMGGDSLRELPKWGQPRDFLKACHALAVMRRPDDLVDLAVLEEQLPGIGAKVRFVDTPLLEISASQIRRRAAEGRPYRYFVSPGVFEIIKDRELYS